MATASRRQLFYRLLENPDPPSVFNWYTLDSPQACPPRSLFVLLLLFTAAVSLPAVGLGFMGHQPAMYWLLGIAAMLLACLLYDVFSTYGRYRDWRAQWLCSRCRRVFFSRQQYDEQQLIQTTFPG